MDARLLADLFGDAPVATLEPEPQMPQFADRIVVRKSERTLELLHDGAVFESFPIALGREPRGQKQEEGDGRTPEGIYRIDSRSLQTRYTRALHISYPDEQDRDRARAAKADPGGAIFIHGLPSDYGPFDPPQWYRDWTEGCISVAMRRSSRFGMPCLTGRQLRFFHEASIDGSAHRFMLL